MEKTGVIWCNLSFQAVFLLWAGRQACVSLISKLLLPLPNHTSKQYRDKETEAPNLYSPHSSVVSTHVSKGFRIWDSSFLFSFLILCLNHPLDSQVLFLNLTDSLHMQVICFHCCVQALWLVSLLWVFSNTGFGWIIDHKALCLHSSTSSGCWATLNSLKIVLIMWV